MPGADNHPDVVDTSFTIEGYALSDPRGKFEPFSYHPRKLLDDEVEVQITHCGICASDIHCAFGGWGGANLPLIVGHEIVGHISKVGSAVTQFKVGDRVGVGAQCGACSDFGKTCRGCADELSNHCSEAVWTYNSFYPDGQKAHGGYASHKRLNQNFVFHIPSEIGSAEAAPLLCAGVTVYAPLKRHGAGKGKRVGIVGLGGLGHLAVQYSAKMGAETFAFGTSPAKRDLAIKLGASEYVNINDAEQMKSLEGSFDLILSTADAAGQDYMRYLRLGKFDSAFVMAAVPDEPMSIRPWPMSLLRVSIHGSAIGSPAEVRDMLDFSAKHNVRPMIELLPMSEVNKGIEKVRKNDVKFRVVLEQGK